MMRRSFACQLSPEKFRLDSGAFSPHNVGIPPGFIDSSPAAAITVPLRRVHDLQHSPRRPDRFAFL
jgi:hypothetical protein